eukprot:GAHX01000290.1.p1 GENE.GAHX01000290.1~~GAHX01000290.1.p1  ORF type:complete len:446 (+),score=141.36 GAHX01000290.1:45-1382(+)
MNRKSRQSLAPSLSSEDTKTLANLNIALETKLSPEIFSAPSTSQLIQLFTSLARLLITCTEARIEHRKQILPSYAEAYKFYLESIDNFYLLTTFGSFMHEVIMVKDFSFQDVIGSQSAPKRIRKVLNSIMNFLYFREAVLQPIYEIENNNKSKIGELNKINQKKKKVFKKLENLNEEIEMGKRELNKEDKARSESKKENIGLRELLAKLKNKLKNKNSEFDEIKNLNLNKMQEIERIKNNKKNVDYILCNNPSAIKNIIVSKTESYNKYLLEKKELLNSLKKEEEIIKKVESVERLVEKRAVMTDKFLGLLLNAKSSARNLQKNESLKENKTKQIKELEVALERLKEDLNKLTTNFNKFQTEVNERKTSQEKYKEKNDIKIGEVEMNLFDLNDKIRHLEKDKEIQEEELQKEKAGLELYKIHLEKNKKKIEDAVKQYHKSIMEYF